MVLISDEKVFTEIILWRRNNGFHFSPKKGSGVQNAICAFRELKWIKATFQTTHIKSCHRTYFEL